MARRTLQNAKVLVTGASSGIGRSLCLKLARRGAIILATARRESRLVELAAECKSIGTLHYLAGDLVDPTHRQRLSDWIHSSWGSLDILVNNAGAGAIGPFDTATEDRLRQVMEVDFFAPVELTRICLPLLQKGKRPAILNIGSVLAHRAVPNKSEYCAAKFAIRGWSEAIRVELAPQGIDVLMLSPSTTRSEFFDSLLLTANDTPSPSVGSMSPDEVAEFAISAIVRSKREMILSLGGKALVWAGRFFPSLTDRMLARFSRD